MRQDELDTRISLTAKECEQLTGIKANTFLYWAWADADRKPGEPKLGPPSFKAGRRRLWLRSALLDWLAEAQNTSR